MKHSKDESAYSDYYMVAVTLLILLL